MIGDLLWLQGGSDKASFYDNLGDTATIYGFVHNRMFGGKAIDLLMVMDSGCSKAIITDDIMRALGVRASLVPKVIVLT